MPSANETMRRTLWLALLAAGGAGAANETPRDFLADADALQQRFAAEVDRPVFVLEVVFGPSWVEMLVQDKADPEVFDQYHAQPNDRVSRPKPVKVGEVSCPKSKIPFEQVRLAGAAAALRDAEAIAAGGGFKSPGVIQFRPDVFCKNQSWRVMMMAPDNSDDTLELLYGQDGKLASAQRFDGNRFKKVDPKALARGEVVAQAAPKPEPAPSAAPDGRKRDFRADPLAAVALLEKTIPPPLKLIDANFDPERATFQLIDPNDRKRVLTYFVHDDGKVEQWNASDTSLVVCAKPFATSEVPIALLPELEQRALRAIPPMSAAKAEDVRIRRSGLCSAPHVYFTLEDDRATGDVEFDAKGKLVEAKVR